MNEFTNQDFQIGKVLSDRADVGPKVPGLLLARVVPQLELSDRTHPLHMLQFLHRTDVIIGEIKAFELTAVGRQARVDLKTLETIVT